jgi:myosin heavy subunit
MFIKNQNQNNYQRFYPSSKRGLPSLKKLCCFLILITIIATAIIIYFRSKKKNKDSLINANINEKKIINEKLQSEINTLNTEISELNKKSTELKTELEKLEKDKENKKDKGNSELKEINNKLSSIEKEYNDIEDKTKKMNEEIEKINKDNEESEKKIKELTDKIESLEKEKDSKIKKTSTLADTVILTDDNIKSILNSFDSKLDLNLLYRTSKHGKEITEFKDKVGKHKNLLIVGKTSDNLILGGYTTINLEGSGYKEDKYAFLYNFNKGKKFKVKKEKEALYLKKGEFPCFGDGDITFGPGKIKIKFPKSYKGDNLELTEGKSEISFDDIEVFYLSIQK